MTLISKLIKGLLKHIAYLFLSVAAGLGLANAVEMVETTGRALILSSDGKVNARMLALEEALYLAALKGGAKIDGFSAVETSSAISENFVIRPASKIVDYTITNEEHQGEHYSVTILAAVGNIEHSECKVGSIINITNYKPKLSINANVPAWFQVVARKLYSELITEFHSVPNFNLVNAGTESLDIRKLNSTNDAYDYTSLTTGRTRVETGGYAMVLEVSFSKEKVLKQDLIDAATDYVTMAIRSNIYEGDTYIPIFSQEDKIKVLIKKEGVSRIVNILSAPSRDKIISELETIIPLHVEDMKSKLNCQPLMAKLSIEGKRLRIRIGEKHGIKLSSLAITESNSSPWTLLRVTELGTNYTILEPLDSSKDLKKMSGLKIKFLEEL